VDPGLAFTIALPLRPRMPLQVVLAAQLPDIARPLQGLFTPAKDRVGTVVVPEGSHCHPEDDGGAKDQEDDRERIHVRVLSVVTLCSRDTAPESVHTTLPGGSSRRPSPGSRCLLAPRGGNPQCRPLSNADSDPDGQNPPPGSKAGRRSTAFVASSPPADASVDRPRCPPIAGDDASKRVSVRCASVAVLDDR